MELTLTRENVEGQLKNGVQFDKNVSPASSEEYLSCRVLCLLSLFVLRVRVVKTLKFLHCRLLKGPNFCQ